MSEVRCDESAVFMIFWPGTEPLVMCPVHCEQAVNVARAMGFALTVAVLEDSDDKCSWIRKEGAYHG